MEVPNILSTSFPMFNPVHLTVFINKPVLMGVLVVFFVIYSILSGVLFYHWHAYGMRSRGIIVAETFFFFVSIVLFVMAGLTIYYY